MEHRQTQTAYDRWTVQQDVQTPDEIVGSAMYNYLRDDLGLSEDAARKRAAKEVDCSAAHEECDDCEQALLPKWIGTIYLKARGRDPRFLNESITYTTLPSVRRSFARAGFACHREMDFAQSLSSPNKTNLRWRFWKAVASVSGKAAALRGIMILDGCRRLCATPITEIMQKPIES